MIEIQQKSEQIEYINNKKQPKRNRKTTKISNQKI